MEGRQQEIIVTPSRSPTAVRDGRRSSRSPAVHRCMSLKRLPVSSRTCRSPSSSCTRIMAASSSIMNCDGSVMLMGFALPVPVPTTRMTTAMWRARTGPWCAAGTSTGDDDNGPHEVLHGVVIVLLVAQQQDIFEQYLPILLCPRVLTLEVRHHVLNASPFVEKTSQCEAPCVHEHTFGHSAGSQTVPIALFDRPVPSRLLLLERAGQWSDDFCRMNVLPINSLPRLTQKSNQHLYTSLRHPTPFRTSNPRGADSFARRLSATSITTSRTSLNSSVVDGSQDCLFARIAT